MKNSEKTSPEHIPSKAHKSSHSFAYDSYISYGAYQCAVNLVDFTHKVFFVFPTPNAKYRTYRTEFD